MIKEKKLNSQEATYQTILENIFKGKLKPGEVVTETSISEQFGISRTPVREALKKLEVEGLIETEGRTKKIYYLSLEDIEEIFDLKIAIESEIARKAALNDDKDLKEKLGDVLIGMNNLKETVRNNKEDKILLDEWIKLDKEFHRILFQLAKNRRAQQFTDRLNIQWHRIKLGITAIEGRIEKAIFEHSAIGDAIIENNAEEAAVQMRLHLSRLKDFLSRLMQTFV